MDYLNAFLCGGILCAVGQILAAAAAHVHILPLQIVEQQPAVLVVLRHVHAVARKEVRDDLVPELAEIAGDDEIVVRG